MAFDDGLDDDEPVFRPPLPPDDRLWRHPSEVGQESSPSVSDVLRRPQRPPRAWAIALVSGLVGALLATGLSTAAGRRDDRPSVERVVEPRGDDAPSDIHAGVATVAERLRPAIVQIVVDQPDGEASGSGVIFRDDGHVLTNNHVTEKATRVSVILSDGRTLKGKVVGGDAAVVKIDGGPFPTAPLGSATKLRAGEECIAIGSPLGLAGGPSVSVGVVSALGRSLDAGSHHLYDMIQTDAAISPGSSGGALLDDAGSVIGVTTAIAVSDAGAEGLGFATPIDIARSIAEELIKTGHATHVWLGVEGADLDQASADRIGISGGAAVKKVVAGSPAGKAGLRGGDVIVAVDGKKIGTMAALVVVLRTYHVGTTVGVDYVRDGKHQSTKLQLEERPAG